MPAAGTIFTVPAPVRTSRSRTATVATSAGGVLCESCLLADTVSLRLRGLLGRRELPAGEGVWIRPTNSIHMFFMRFAVDAVFLDRDDEVLRIVHGLRPWRMASCRRARSVVELAQGEAARRGLEVGQTLRVVEEDADAVGA
jgi:uncharacterized membrane protein (UPF0127 family)